MLVGLLTEACGEGIPEALRVLGLTRPVSVLIDVAYGNHPEQRLDLYLHPSIGRGTPDSDRDPAPRPLLLFFHGGGWIERPDEPYDLRFAMPFLNRGWHVALATYRLGLGTAPMAVDDALCATRWAFDSADVYGFDPEGIVVAGFSAGGHLALTSAILASRPGHPCSLSGDARPLAAINWAGITDIAAVQTYLAESRPQANYALDWAGSEERIPELSQRYSPVVLVDETAPLLISVHGDRDRVVPLLQATSFHERLEEIGVPNRLFIVEGGHRNVPHPTADMIADSIFRLIDLR